MKKLLFITAAAVLLILSGCASTDKAETAVATEDTTPVEPVVTGTWNDAKTEYTIDLAKITAPDTDLVLNDDGTLTCTYAGNYSQLLIPIPYTDDAFMSEMTKMTIIVSSDYNGMKKFAWKLSSDLENSWGNGGGILGQGENCVGYAFRDYEDAWSNTPVTLYFNGDDDSFDPMNEYKGFKAVAMCHNKSGTNLSFTIKSIVFSKE